MQHRVLWLSWRGRFVCGFTVMGLPMFWMCYRPRGSWNGLTWSVCKHGLLPLFIVVSHKLAARYITRLVVWIITVLYNLVIYSNPSNTKLNKHIKNYQRSVCLLLCRHNEKICEAHLISLHYIPSVNKLKMSLTWNKMVLKL